MADDEDWFDDLGLFYLFIVLSSFEKTQWGDRDDHDGDIQGFGEKLPVDLEPVFQEDFHPVGQRGSCERLFIDSKVVVVVEWRLHSYKVIRSLFI